MSPTAEATRRSAKAQRIIAAIMLAISVFSPALAYDLPPVNLGNTTYFDGAVPPTGPGLYGIEYLTFYDAGRFAGADGKKLPLPAQSLHVFAPTTMFIYAAEPKIFGMARPGVTVLLPTVAAASVNDGLNGAVLRSSTGFGDAVFGAFLSFDPIMGGAGPLFAQSLEFDVIAPTGAYSRTVAITPGSNFLSINPFYAATLWATPQWSFSGRFHYLWNATNDQPKAGLGPAALTSQAGQALHMNLATHYQQNSAWGIGLNGYYLQQVTDTRVNGAAVPGRRERVFAVGPGVTFNLTPDYSVFLNAYREFAAENRAEGTRIVLRFNGHF